MTATSIATGSACAGTKFGAAAKLSVGSSSREVMLTCPNRTFSGRDCIGGASGTGSSLVFILPHARVRIKGSGDLRLEGCFLTINGAGIGELSTDNAGAVTVGSVALRGPLSVMGMGLSAACCRNCRLGNIGLFASGHTVSKEITCYVGSDMTAVGQGVSKICSTGAASRLRSCSINTSFRAPRLFGAPGALCFITCPQGDGSIDKHPISLMICLRGISSGKSVIRAIALPVEVSRGNGIGLRTNGLARVAISSLSPDSGSRG